MEFTLRYVVDYKYRRVKKDQLFTRILDEYMATEGKIEYYTATLALVKTPVLNVRLNDDQAKLTNDHQ